ncbi:MAG: thioredoxin family protein [Rhodospirillales bacterium]|nr:thioredoxin family protein [Rhodospirillales bacterium]MBO6786574.1 thioredoxin family protein [Rhodospirillales bacterium]
MIRLIAALILIVASMSPARAATVGDNGLHIQPWFLDSFLILAEDVEDAASDGKRVAVLIEQRGCPYCREMHQVNLANTEITDFIKANFSVIQLDMWGSREVTDLDGTVMEERELVRRWRANFTPTIVFLPTPEEMAAGKTEVARMPGYFKPFHFISMFEYVHQKAYDDQVFQRFLQDKFKRLEEEGKKPEVW